MTPPALLYIAVPTDDLLSVLAWGIEEVWPLVTQPDRALHITLSDRFAVLKHAHLSLALFAVDTASLDPNSLASPNASPWQEQCRYAYRQPIPAHALKLLAIYEISAQAVEFDPAQDVPVDLDVYGDFAAYL